MSTTPAHRCDCRGFAEASSLPTTWVATVPGTYPTPEAGTCTQYVQYVVPGGKPPCASGTYPTREAGTRSPYVPYGGPRGVRVSLDLDQLDVEVQQC